MPDILERYVSAGKQLMDYFGCRGDYFLRVMTGSEWNALLDDTLPMLRYRDGKGGAVVSAVIVKKDGAPLVYPAERLTMIIAIDCVKIGFIFNNADKNEKL